MDFKFRKSLDLTKRNTCFNDFIQSIIDDIMRRMIIRVSETMNDGKVMKCPILDGRGDSGFFHLYLTSREGMKLTARISLKNLYLIGIEINGIWYFFDEYPTEFQNVHGISLFADGSYLSLGDLLSELSFSTDSINNAINKLQSIQAHMSDEHKEALSLIIVAVCESVRFTSVKNTVARSFVPPSETNSSGTNILPKATQMLIVKWKRNSERILRRATPKDPNPSDILYYVYFDYTITLKDVSVLKVSTKFWDETIGLIKDKYGTNNRRKRNDDDEKQLRKKKQGLGLGKWWKNKEGTITGQSSDDSSLIWELNPKEVKVLEHALVYLTRTGELFASSPDKLDELCNHGLVALAINLVSIFSSGGQSSLSTSTYTGMIRLLLTCVSRPPLVAKDLILLGTSGTLKDVSRSGLVDGATVSPALSRRPEQVFESSNSGLIRLECLFDIRKLMYYSLADMIQTIIGTTNISSFLAGGILAWKEFQVLIPALQISSILMEKLSKTFSKMFIREGVVHTIDSLIQPDPANSSPNSDSHPSNQTSTSSLSRRYRRHTAITDHDESKNHYPETTTPGVNSSLRVVISGPSKSFKDKCFTSDPDSVGVQVTGNFCVLRTLCAKLNNCADVAKFKGKGELKLRGGGLFDILAGTEEQIDAVVCEILAELSKGDQVSKFEFVGSEIEMALLSHIPSGGGTAGKESEEESVNAGFTKGKRKKFAKSSYQMVKGLQTRSHRKAGRSERGVDTKWTIDNPSFEIRPRKCEGEEF